VTRFTRRYILPRMENPASILPVLAIIAVAFVLCLGLVNMMRGGSPNTSQKLMRWRVGLQAAALVVIMATIYFTRH